MSNIIAKLKVVAGAVVANFITGRLIAFAYKQRIPFYDTVIDVSDPLITNHAKASIFFRLYEKHEDICWQHLYRALSSLRKIIQIVDIFLYSP